MNKQDEERKPVDNVELPKEQACACEPGCGCHASGASGKMRWILGAIVLIAAAVLVARALITNHSVSDNKAAAGFAALATPGQTPTPGASVVAATDAVPATSAAAPGNELATLSELNTVATNMDGVFVFLPGKGETAASAPIVQILAATKTLESQGGTIGYFTLKTDSTDYEQIATQMAVPGVLAIVKGRGMSAASGDITETKLVQAFVAASGAGACGPSGCGPSGCN